MEKIKLFEASQMQKTVNNHLYDYIWSHRVLFFSLSRCWQFHAAKRRKKMSHTANFCDMRRRRHLSAGPGPFELRVPYERCDNTAPCAINQHQYKYVPHILWNFRIIFMETGTRFMSVQLWTGWQETCKENLMKCIDINREMLKDDRLKWLPSRSAHAPWSNFSRTDSKIDHNNDVNRWEQKLEKPWDGILSVMHVT